MDRGEAVRHRTYELQITKLSTALGWNLLLDTTRNTYNRSLIILRQVSFVLLITHYLLPTTYHLLLSTHYLSLNVTTHYRLPTTCYSLDNN